MLEPTKSEDQLNMKVYPWLKNFQRYFSMALSTMQVDQVDQVSSPTKRWQLRVDLSNGFIMQISDNI